jgi:hypothetical protein
MANAIPLRRQSLSVVDASTGARGELEFSAQQTPVERVFEHWVVMLQHSRTRVALGPTRRRAVEKALELYDVETLLMAIEGCASSRWHGGDNDRGRAYNDLTFIVHNEERIERFAAMGEALRLRDAAAQRAAVQAAAEPAPAPADEEQAFVQRARLADLARQLRSGRIR